MSSPQEKGILGITSSSRSDMVNKFLWGNYFFQWMWRMIRAEPRGDVSDILSNYNTAQVNSNSDYNKEAGNAAWRNG